MTSYTPALARRSTLRTVSGARSGRIFSTISPFVVCDTARIAASSATLSVENAGTGGGGVSRIVNDLMTTGVSGNPFAFAALLVRCPRRSLSPTRSRCVRSRRAVRLLRPHASHAVRCCGRALAFWRSC